MLSGLMFCALSVGASRVLLGMHYLSDVVVGALTGAMLGFAACAIVL
jgi:undecaprenyl-diphosphatase